jgi:hypothetical protein
MPTSSPSALVTDNGQRILLRVHRRFYQLSQEELRTLLNLPPGPPGVGITIDGEQLSLEFAADNQKIEISATELHRRLAKLIPS